MASEIIRPSDKDIDDAGRVLVELRRVREREAEWLEAVRVVDSWRRLHSGPLQTFRSNLRRRGRRRDIVATRLKRLPSIIGKLERLSRIKLSRMQDIGGCRIIVDKVDDAFDLATELTLSRMRHEIVRRDNYIDKPRESGYRGIHLVYSYRTERRDHLNGLNVEIQFRSQAQHQWATAVETFGTFLGEQLKSGIGSRNWLRFFALMSTVIAQREGKLGVPNTPSAPQQLREEIRAIDREVGGVVGRLTTIPHLARLLEDSPGKNYYWHVLQLDAMGNSVHGQSFRRDDEAEASSRYLEAELEHRDDAHIDTVMVSTQSVSALRRAYPNYFADLTAFRGLLQDVLDDN